MERLRKVLSHLKAVSPQDGIFIDWCCAPTGDPLTALLTRSIFEQCHVIFLPTADYFTRSWCTFECMTWLLSPFPNQAIGDFNLFQCIHHISVSLYGRPPFVLDRPELQALGRLCIGSTDATEAGDKEFLSWTIGENRMKSTGLRESLIKLILKFESAIIY